MEIREFVKEEASQAHGDTILADDFLPERLDAPFDSAWGYLEAGKRMESHAHPTEEIYVIIKGEGTVEIEEEREKVKVGDVVAIPPDKEHSIEAGNDNALLWAALWWEV